MLTGSLVAIVTPMKKGGALDLPALGKLIDFHVANGTSGIVIVGTTGESPTVDVDEHCLLIKTAVDEARGRIPIVAGTGANSTAEAVALTAYAKEAGRAQRAFRRSVLQQADAGRAVSPLPHDRRKGRPAAPPVQRARAHRRRHEQRDDPASGRGARASSASRTPPRISAAAASSSRRLGAASRREFAVYSGDDITALPLLLMGGHGVISVTANVAPKLMAEMCRAALAGDIATARNRNDRLLGLHREPLRRGESDPREVGARRDGPDRERAAAADGAARPPEYHEAVRAALSEAGCL